MRTDDAGVPRWSRLDVRLLLTGFLYLVVVAGLQAWASPTAELD